NPTEHYRNLDDTPGVNPNPLDDLDPVTVVVQEDAEEPVENIGIERSDGALIIYLDGRRPPKESSSSAKKHDANLAEHIDTKELARICDELLNGIDSDRQSRQEWLERRASGLKHLALNI